MHRDLLQQRLLVRVQEVVAPLHKRSQRRAGVGGGLLVKQRQAPLDQREQLRESEHVHPRRGQLDGKRQAVDAPGDGSDQASRLGVELKPRPGDARTRQEECDGRRVDIVGALRARERQRLDRDPSLPRHVQHLSARRHHAHAWTAANDLLDHAPHLGEQPLAGIEHQDRLRVAQALHHTLQLIAATGVDSASQQTRDVGRRRRAREVDEPDAVRDGILKRPDGLQRDPALPDPGRPD